MHLQYVQPTEITNEVYQSQNFFSITSAITLTKDPHSCGVVSLNNNVSEKNETVAFVSMSNLNVIRRVIIVIYFLSGN